jgi:hypothetical protein
MGIRDLVRKETQDERLALGATYMDDIDLVYSKTIVGPWGPALVAVAQKHGQHVCWQCGEAFIDEPRNKNRPEEVQTGYSRILLHAGCVQPAKSYRKIATSLFADKVRGMQLRRGMAKAAKGSQSVATAAGEDSERSRIIT